MQEIIKYQELDSQLRKIEAELSSSDNRKNASKMQDYLREGQARLIKLEEVSKNLTAQYEKAVSLYNEFISKLEALDKQVETLSKENVEEYSKTIQNFVKTAENLENNINILANKMASASKEVDGIMANAKKARHNLEIYKANYLKEKEKLEPEINRLKQELAKQKTKVDPKLLAKYNSKSEGKIFPIFVPEVKGRCGGCRMEISAGKLSILKANKVIECENCGRVIYVEE